MSRKYKFNENSFKQLTPDSMYWLGVLFADGYINWKSFSSPQTVLDMKDLDHLEKYKQFLESDFKILKQISRTRILKDGSFSTTWRININSEKIAKDIEKTGFETETPIEELENSIDFWRGVVDGDGSIYINKKSYSLGFSLVGKKSILESFRRFIIKNGIKTKCKICKHKSIFSISLTRKNAINLLKILYYKDCKSFLNRKFSLFINYINSDYPGKFGMGKNYLLTTIDGKTIKLRNLTKFCNEFNLDLKEMVKLRDKKINSYKEYCSLQLL